MKKPNNHLFDHVRRNSLDDGVRSIQSAFYNLNRVSSFSGSFEIYEVQGQVHI